MWREFDKRSSICFLAISFISSLLNKTASSPSGWSREQGNQAKRAKEKYKKLRGSLAILLAPVLPNLDSTDWRGAAHSLPLNLFSWWCIDIAGRKLMLVTLGTKRVKPSVVSNILFSVDRMICRCTSTLASGICKETLRSLFWALKESIIWNAFWFSFTLIGKSIRSFLTGKSWNVLKYWYTGGYLEQGFWHCFAKGLNQSLVSYVVQSTLRSP